MTARPVGSMPGPDTGSYEVMNLGGQAAVVVPVVDFLRLRAPELHAPDEELAEAEDAAALADWTARQAVGRTSYVPHGEVRTRLGLPPT